MTGTPPENVTADELAARVADLDAAGARRLPGLAHFLDSYAVTAVHLTPAGDLVVFGDDPDGTAAAVVEMFTAEQFLDEFDLDPGFADDYRAIARAGDETAGPWPSPDVAPLAVPVRAFLAEVDAVLDAIPTTDQADK